jgi:cyanophycin synthetase
MHPDVDAAVFEIRTGGVLRRALGFDRCAVAVVTVAAAPPQAELHHHRQDLAVLKRVVVQNVATNWLCSAQCG